MRDQEGAPLAADNMILLPVRCLSSHAPVT